MGTSLPLGRREKERAEGRASQGLRMYGPLIVAEICRKKYHRGGKRANGFQGHLVQGAVHGGTGTVKGKAKRFLCL